MKLLKTESEIAILEESGAILAHMLHALEQRTQQGVNLLDLDAFAQSFIKEHHAQPAFLGYQPEGARHPYPAALCTSLNETVVHGIPKDYTLKNGDVLKIDAGVIYEGMYTDAAITVTVGPTSPTTRKLIAATKQALADGIAMAKQGNTIGDIGWAIEQRTKKSSFHVLRGLTGHGVGYELHEDPVIFNFGKRSTGATLVPGMVIAIEPMLSVSSDDIIQNRDESYAAADGSMTAHFEHTIAITKRGTKVLTQLSSHHTH